jgi:predicted DNA-binding transcriptional regulator AlpA
VQLPEPIRPQRPSPLLIDTSGVAALLGRSVSSIERDDREGRIPALIRIGRHKRWRSREIEAWINAGCPLRAEWKFKGSVRRRTADPTAPGA